MTAVSFRLADIPPHVLRLNPALAAGGNAIAQLEATQAPCAPKPRRAGTRAPNKTEQRFNREVLAGKGKFEAITFKMTGGSRYSPDFVLTEPDGRIGCYEVKGSYRLPSEGRALTAFRECRAWAEERFPGAFRFRWFRRSKDGWQELHTI